MKTTHLLFAVSLVLAACQGNETPTAKAPTMAHQLTSSSSNAVEVTRSVESHAARAMQKSMNQASAQRDAAVEELANTSTAAVKKVEARVVTAAKPVQKAVAEAKSVATPATIPTKAPMPTLSKSTASVAEATKPASPADAMGDANKGKKISRKCQACHNFTKTKKVGPGLAGIYGRKAGIMPDMKYSAAVAAGGWVWNAEHLKAWMCDSKKAIKVFSGNASAKTKMGAQRVCDPAKQADLIAYLKTL